MTDTRYSDYEDRGRSEYGRAGDGDRMKPSGLRRPLSTSERARAVRSAGLRPNTDTNLSDTGDRVA